MILSFSREIPDPKTGGKKKSFFKEKIQGKAEFVKKHTFRSGKRWKVGDKIHFWDMSPRLKGKVSPDPEAFNPRSELVFDWQYIAGGADIMGLGNDLNYSGWFPELDTWVPGVSAIDEFAMEFRYNSGVITKGGWVTMELHFGGMEYVYFYDPFNVKVYKIDGDLEQFPITMLAINDGFTCQEDFFFYFWNRHKLKKKDFSIEGQIVHWAGRSYRDLMLAAEELKELI